MNSNVATADAAVLVTLLAIAAKLIVWAYDFVFDRTGDGRQLKFLTVVDEYSRQCLAIDVDRKQTSREVLRTLAKLMLRYGVPKHIRSDNGPEFVARAVRSWLARLGCKNAICRAGQPLEERLHRKLQW